MSDEIAIQIISKLVKQRKESASIFKSKTGWISKRRIMQIKYLEVYFKQLSEDEIEEYIRTKLNEMDNVSLKDMQV